MTINIEARPYAALRKFSPVKYRQQAEFSALRMTN
jgi:hypothetical protein